MSSSPPIPPIPDHREFPPVIRGLFAELEKLRSGPASGIHLAAKTASYFEEVILRLHLEVLEDYPEQIRKQVEANSAIVLVGGSGRGEMVPFSDCDILFLHNSSVPQEYVEITSEVIRKLWDEGVRVGSSVRTVSETCQIGKEDIQVASSVVEARLLTGSLPLYQRLRSRFTDRVIRRRLPRFISDCVEARKNEREHHGGSPSILQPNVKRSPGGLRDIHLLRWVGYACHGSAAFDQLLGHGALSREDHRVIIEALDRLLMIRINLHMFAGREHDLLVKEDQMRIAEEWGVQPRLGMMPVEVFMQDYFLMATQVEEIVNRFVDRHRSRGFLNKIIHTMLKRRVGKIFLLSPKRIDVLPRAKERLLKSPELILEMYLFVARDGVRLPARLEVAIRNSVPDFPERVSSECSRLFQLLLDTPDHLGKALRLMLRTNVLQYLVPQFAHARCLIQFNQYHSYTVDEHTFFTIEAACNFLSDPGPVGMVRRNLGSATILNLALLIHDVGKGYDEDHSEVGRRIAEDVAERLHLPKPEAERLAFLVHKHLLMVHLAFRRNVTEPGVLLQFTQDVGNPQTLKELYVLSASDLSGVGPEVWTEWKAELLSILYDEAMHVLSGHRPRSDQKRIEDLRQKIAEKFAQQSPMAKISTVNEWAENELKGLSPQYLANVSETQILDDLATLDNLPEEGVSVMGEYDPDTLTTVYRVIAKPVLNEGCFTAAAGVLAAKRMQIVDAVIETTASGMAIDRYRVMDEDFENEVPKWRIAEVERLLRSAILGELAIPKLFRRHQRFGEEEATVPITVVPTQVRTDTSTSESCTIIDVFAHDRRGLLYTIATTLKELNVSVELAKISTHLDQVVDVFYITDSENKKITDESHLRHISAAVSIAVDRFWLDGYREFITE
ncbi:[protein-PII] uridylyltransferase [Calycomorphotria hydatis]|uniref:Bifunctional uridylyltransferase/uridylyl-removing enzyme n=1 Tax=Calycomorphotria hydatis TaxID=2528027 RepID=A0A517TC33_9PLAN|nr:[protein-PII] uridylyltransferase [Calycomorphotria hydatis]QDT65937.1 Bifunctional uridylyltransferase/uridylyl-removing enzyme [Calycomorphotria hydatis]